jgi:hypothetical protein
MVTGALRKGFDKRDGKAESRSDKKRPNLLDVAFSTGIELFHDRDKRGFISVPQANGGAFHYPISSDGAKHWLRSLIYSKTSKPIARQALEDIVLTLEARAIYGSPLHDIAVRIGREGDAIYFDLGRPDAVVVRITPGGWALTPDCPIKFVRPAGFGELPEPTRNGKVRFIRELLQLDDAAWTLILAFLINCLRPGGPTFAC